MHFIIELFDKLYIMRNYITFQVVRKNIFRSSVHHIAYRLISITFPSCESYNAHKPLKYTIRGVTVQFTLEKARMLASSPPSPPEKKRYESRRSLS